MALVLPGLLGLADANAPRRSDKGATLDRTWQWIGPMASGKTEYEGNPLAAHGGVLELFAAEKMGHERRSLLSEYIVGGKLSWSTVRSDHTGVALPYNHVDWAGLQQGGRPVGGPADALHAQYWVVGRVRTVRAGAYSLDCAGLHTFELVRFAANGTVAERTGPLVGNVYRRGAGIGRAAVELAAPAEYHLFARVRGKPVLSFRCDLHEGGKLVAAGATGAHSPDVVLSSTGGGTLRGRTTAERCTTHSCATSRRARRGRPPARLALRSAA